MSELTPYNLNVGSLILYVNLACTVIEIYSNGVRVEVDEKTAFRLFEDIKPIPLTIEWLKRAGYKQLKRVEKTYSLSDFEDNSSIYFTGVRFIHINTGTHLEYVHEWQNIYSAIYKQELKFT